MTTKEINISNGVELLVVFISRRGDLCFLYWANYLHRQGLFVMIRIEREENILLSSTHISKVLFFSAADGGEGQQQTLRC